MKLAYVTSYNSADIHAWSGAGNYILRSFQNHSIQIDRIDDLKKGAYLSIQSSLKKIYYSKVRSQKYMINREPAILRQFSKQIINRIDADKIDIVFSPGTIPIAYLKTEKPKVFWTDATFAGMINYYPEFTDLCSETIRNGSDIEQSALSDCRLAIYSSEWAANTAIENYRIDPSKVKVVPFGANIICNRGIHDINILFEKKEFDICKLLFIGVDWYRKGGDKALAIAEMLNKHGLKTELHVVGCNLPMKLPSYIINHGFISKKNEEGKQLINQLFSKSHFFILPSIAECFGIVFAEACSFGLPSLTTNTGGISSVIKNGKNGFCFTIHEPIETYCSIIEQLMSSKEEYRKLALSSFQEYNDELNWYISGKKVIKLMEENCF